MGRNNSKGFTLVELLVTIGIVGLILSISILVVNVVINKSRDNSNEITVDNIKRIVDLYVKEYKKDLNWDDDNKTCILVETFFIKGYLKEELLDNKNLPSSIIVTRDEINQIVNQEMRYDLDCDGYSKSVKIPDTNEICNNFIYTGDSHSLVHASYDNNKIEYLDNNYSNLNDKHPSEVGQYKVSVTLDYGKHWDDGTKGPKIFTCQISKREPKLKLTPDGDNSSNFGTTTITLESDVDGIIKVKSSNESYASAEVVGDNKIKAHRSKEIKVTTYASRKSITNITVSVEPTGVYNRNYNKGSVIYTIGDIENKRVEKPTSSLCNNLIYTGKQQALISPNDGYLLFDNYGTEVGKYVVTARLKYGYLWNDNTKDDVKINCEIKEVKPTITYKDAVCSSQQVSVIYNRAYGYSQNLCVPTKIGYTFMGWYKESSYTNKVTDNTLVTNSSDHNLYAKWQVNTYTVILNANGGSISPGSINVSYNSKYDALKNPTRAGYDFVGWFTQLNGGTEVTSDTVLTNAYNHTLYARWNILFSSQTFGYTGSVQTFTVPVTGTYKLEVFGARGGIGTYVYMIETYPGSPLTCAYAGTSIDARANGNASGNFKFNKGDVLYVYVGGTGGDGVSVADNATYCDSPITGKGGYNGGQTGDVYTAGSGGATHISLTAGTYTNSLKDSGYILLSAKGGDGYWEGYGGYRIFSRSGGGTTFVNTSSSYFVDSAKTKSIDTATEKKAVITLVSVN